MYQEYFERVDAAFGRIQADPKWSSFTLDQIKMLGVRKLVEQYKKPFDKIGQSKISAEKLSAERGRVVTPQEVLDEWAHKGKVSTVLGVAAHSYMENRIANKPFRYPIADVKEAFPDEPDPVFDNFSKITIQMDKFREDIRGKLIPVGSEVVIGSPKYMVCGIVDQIFWNKKAGEFQIWDWKTNGKFELDSRFKLLPPFDMIGNCEYDEYSMQLNLYKRIFMEETGIPIGTCYICWFSPELPAARMLPAKDFYKEAGDMLQLRANQLGLVDQGSVF